MSERIEVVLVCYYSPRRNHQLFAHSFTYSLYNQNLPISWFINDTDANIVAIPVQL